MGREAIYEVCGDGHMPFPVSFASEADARALLAELEADEREEGVDSYGGHYHLTRIELPATPQAMCEWLNSVAKRSAGLR